jgi:hypothetical protein
LLLLLLLLLLLRLLIVVACVCEIVAVCASELLLMLSAGGDACVVVVVARVLVLFLFSPSCVSVFRCSLCADKTAVLQAEMEAKQQELVPWNKKISESKAALELANSELSLLEEKEQASARKVKAARQSLESAQGKRGKIEKVLCGDES